MAAVLVPYGMTLALEHRTGRKAESEDIARFGHILAALGSGINGFIRHAISALQSLSMITVGTSEGGMLSAAVFADLMSNKQNVIDPKIVLSIAKEAKSSKEKFYSLIFEHWHNKHNLPVPTLF